ncbi:MAG: MAPEG family protein [Pseudomonadales bacterium]|nr:MAPEG family protein [Pseudomonadales bacterium]MCP5301600.1 MAPEG family protein [Pseudomonadales bacterium]
MNPNEIFLPVLTMFLLTMLVWVYLFAKRIPFINENFVDEEITSQALQERSPPDVSNPSDNLKNLFELPVIFYAVVLAIFTLGLVDPTYLITAWVFAIFRVLHSLIHCTFNHVMARFGMYLVASAALWFMVIRMAYQLVAG